MSWILTWIISFSVGLYLIIKYQDYWIGIPLTIFGSMILWGFVADLVLWVYDKTTRINTTNNLDDLK